MLFLIIMFFAGQEVQASQYEVDFDNEQWSVQLLVETCKEELQEAIDLALEDLDGDFVAILPDTIGYQYFNVVFKKIDGNMVYSAEFSDVEYQFDYLTEDDAHEKCTAVNPRRFIY
jgi:hypothetical protein